MRPWAIPSLLPMITIFATAIFFIVPANFHLEEYELKNILEEQLYKF